eukprot:399742_1
MNKKKQARYRVQTMSESKPPQQKNALKEALSDEDYDDFMAPEPYQMSVNALSPSVHVQIPVSMPKFGAGQISVESGTMSPYSSVVAREMMAEYNIETLGNIGVLMEHEKAVKEWLMSVELPQYYTHFISNGYESMDIIKEITEYNELE